MKTPYKLQLVLFFVNFLIHGGCNDHSEGLFGHSRTREEAKANGSTILEYVADKTHFKLIDGTEMTSDTAWTEVSFTYHNCQKLLDSNYGYHFSIPFKKAVKGSFTFSFELLDTTNRMFTNGIDDDLEQLCPKRLFDTMKVILEQKNPDTLYGWMRPITTDTITYIKIK